MEIWDLYTKDREFTGLEMIRGEEIPAGYFHLVVDVWIKNSEGKFLISQRAADRPSYPLMWECTGGSPIKGETSLEGALREVKEELGIDLQPDQGKLLFSVVREVINGRKFNDIKDVWLFEYNGGVDLQNAPTKEVADFKWLSYEEVKKMFDDGMMVDTLDYFLSTFQHRY